MPHTIVDGTGPGLEPAPPALEDLLQACVAGGHLEAPTVTFKTLA